MVYELYLIQNVRRQQPICNTCSTTLSDAYEASDSWVRMCSTTWLPLRTVRTTLAWSVHAIVTTNKPHVTQPNAVWRMLAIYAGPRLLPLETFRPPRALPRPVLPSTLTTVCRSSFRWMSRIRSLRRSAGGAESATRLLRG